MELYDRTGKVRSPSPVELTDSEEELQALSNEGAEYNQIPTENAFRKPPIVASSGEREGHACGKPDTACSEDQESGPSEEEGSDKDFYPSGSESDILTTSDGSSSDNDSVEGEEGFAIEEDQSNLSKSEAK